ncbi:MAG: ABC transporter permease [Muribaculaceae bacterium]
MNGLMWKLLRKHVSVPQLTGFAIANLVGLTIVILAVQFYGDVRPIFNDEESFIKRDYLVITRKVTGMGALMGSSTEFAPAAVNELQSQPWVRTVGLFDASQYGVRATVGKGGSGNSLQTQFFFESIPDEFIDVSSADWKFDARHPEVPVIVSKDYLSLYNFGFAAAQGMPKISEGMMGMIPLQFTLTGNGMSDTYAGRIVGFSSRLNTILVPEDFMKWSNRRYGDGTVHNPSRLIVEVNVPGDERIVQYMNDKGYEIAGDKMNSGKANYFLTVIISIVIAVGVIISLLSFFVLTLSIYLLLQKNTKKLQDLLMLGYSPAQVAAPYVRMVVAINAVVPVASVALMLAARSWYMDMLHAFGVGGSSLLPAVVVALVIMGCITAGNVLAIRNKVGQLWRQKE